MGEGWVRGREFRWGAGAQWPAPTESAGFGGSRRVVRLWGRGVGG